MNIGIDKASVYTFDAQPAVTAQLERGDIAAAH